MESSRFVLVKESFLQTDSVANDPSLSDITSGRVHLDFCWMYPFKKTHIPSRHIGESHLPTVQSHCPLYNPHTTTIESVKGDIPCMYFQPDMEFIFVFFSHLFCSSFPSTSLGGPPKSSANTFTHDHLKKLQKTSTPKHKHASTYYLQMYLL